MPQLLELLEQYEQQPELGGANEQLPHYGPLARVELDPDGLEHMPRRTSFERVTP